MKYIKLFEDNDREIFVGYHCSHREYSDFNGEISEDYSDRYDIILEKLSNKYKKARLFLQKLQKQPNDSKIIHQIYLFFKQINLNWIFVDEEKPLTMYGDICYSVYFKNKQNIFSIQDSNESGSDYSFMYFYYSDNLPILYKIT